MSSKNSTARQECASKVARATITELIVGKGGNIDLFPVLLSYQYLYMRTRGHEVLTRSSTTQLISAPANERSTAQKYRLLWQRLAIRHPKATQEFHSFSLWRKFWGNAFFLSLLFSPFRLFAFSPFRLSFPSFPFPNNQFHTKSLSRGPSPAFFRSIPIQQKQKAFLLNEMQPGGALALASLRTFFAVRS
jgi:hypothetical protein